MNPDPDSQSIIGKLILLVILTLINAFFAGAEMAFASLNRSRATQKAEQGDKKAIRLLAILSQPNNFLSTIQVGITIINLIAGAFLSDAIAQKLAVWVRAFVEPVLAYRIAAVLSFIILTYISIVFGELYPKRIALNNSEKFANVVVGPIQLIGKITKPFVWLLSASTDLLSRITPMKFDDIDEKMTRDEMRYMLLNEGVLDSEEMDMVEGVFSLESKVAREVMVPRTDSFMIDIEDSLDENLELILTENYSRIPVYKGDKDKVIGILHVKTLLKEVHKVGFAEVKLEDILQDPLFVPETIVVSDLLYEFKKTQNQIAILLDEYGGVVGIVTLEDLLEEIVGEIEDESDEAAELYTQVSENTYIVQGKMLIDEFNQIFKTKLEMDDVDTMAGYFITATGHIPDENETLSYEVDNVTLISEEVDETRVLALKVIFKQEEDAEEEEETEE